MNKEDQFSNEPTVYKGECPASIFLRKKYGSDVCNGVGIKRLLLDFKRFLNEDWIEPVDDSGLPRVEYLVHMYNLNEADRKHPKPDRRIYVAVYAHTVLLWQIKDIAKVMCVTSGSVSTMLSKWVKHNLHEEKQFIEYISPITDRFGELIPNKERSIRLLSKRFRK
jgi:Zn ribbon nucleic-acid-binding protein